MEKKWVSPGRNCGACGYGSCREFEVLVWDGSRKKEDCPFYSESFTRPSIIMGNECSSHVDILGNPFDFILHPLPGECSARKILLPFRPDLVEKWNIQPGDILTGRPMGAGCPVQHVLRVISASPISGVIVTHVVGPLFSRNHEVQDLEAYHMIGFEGLVEVVGEEPIMGKRMRFLPSYCMMNLGHTGVVNLILKREEGLHVRVEDVRIL